MPWASGSGSEWQMVVDRINRAILNLIRKKGAAKRGTLVADATGVRLMDGATARWSIAWNDVQRITALQYPGFVGDTVTLTIEADGDAHIISEEQDGWADAVAALSKHLPGAIRHEEWGLALVAGGAEATVTVFQRR